MWNLKYNTNEHINATEKTHRYREQTVAAEGEGIAGGRTGSWD